MVDVTSPFYMARANLYHLIQKSCDKPAFFWYNYKWGLSADGGEILLNTEDAVSFGHGEDLEIFLMLNPDIPKDFCDTITPLETVTFRVSIED